MVPAHYYQGTRVVDASSIRSGFTTASRNRETDKLGLDAGIHGDHAKIRRCRGAAECHVARGPRSFEVGHAGGVTQVRQRRLSVIMPATLKLIVLSPVVLSA